MEIMTFGCGKRQVECDRILRSLDLGEGRLIVLPIPTTRDNVHLTNTDVKIEGIYEMLDPTVTLAGYSIPDRLADRGARLLDASKDENFLLENARLTANGTLGYILTHYDRDISDLRIGVVGYGRIGSELVRLLLLMGCFPIVYTTRGELALELGKSGVRAEKITDGCTPDGLDVLINTAPAVIFRQKDLPEDLEVIDLASGGIFKPGERVVRLQSLPDAMYPKSAGRIYAQYVISALLSEGDL